MSDVSGSFVEASITIPPDDHINDLSNLDFREEADRRYSIAALEKKPKLLVRSPNDHDQLSDPTCDQMSESMHVRWLAGIALQQYNQGLGILISTEDKNMIFVTVG